MLKAFRFLEKKRHSICFSQSVLKLIGMITMFIDHAAIMLIVNGKLYGYDKSLLANVIKTPEAIPWLNVYRICRIIGRFSFPIFAFLIVEGFRKTSNLYRYLFRILLFAFISEIPFNLMVYNRLFCFDCQNVLFTYFIGLLMLSFIKLTAKFPMILHIVFMLLSATLCWFLKTDYAIEGILLIFVFYEFRDDLNLKSIFAMIILFLSSIKSNFGLAIFAIFFIYFYDGTKGNLNLKKFTYLFFPLHMLALYAIVYFSNLR